jgi:hypothetical protein
MPTMNPHRPAVVLKITRGSGGVICAGRRVSLFGLGLRTQLPRAQAVAPANAPRSQSVVSFFSPAVLARDLRPRPKPRRNPRRLRHDPDGIPSVQEHLPRSAQRADQFAIVRTMHHSADRQFQTNTVPPLLAYWPTEMPPGTPTRRSQSSRPDQWPPSANDRRGPIRLCQHPAADRRIGAHQHEISWSRTGPFGPNTPSGSGSRPPAKPPIGWIVPECFSHDDPNDPERAAGMHEGMVGHPVAGRLTSICRTCCRRVAIPQVENRMALLELGRMATGTRPAARSDAMEARDAYRHQRRGSPAGRPGTIHAIFWRASITFATLRSRGMGTAGGTTAGRGRRPDAVGQMAGTHQNAFRDLWQAVPSLDHV